MLPTVVDVSLVVIAYPKLASSDRARVDSLRAEHDRLHAAVVDPHLTLVFPTALLPSDAMGRHARSCGERCEQITLRLDRVDVVEDDSRNLFRAFLVPSVGYEAVVALHDALYGPPLDTELRRDIAYEPHVTVGAGSRDEMMALAERLDDEGVVIETRANDLTVASFDGAKVLDLLTVPLAHR